MRAPLTFVLLLACAAGAKKKAALGKKRRPADRRPPTGRPLPVAEAWAAAPRLCEGGTRASSRPMLIFVHVFKCAGTTTRRTLQGWAKARDGCAYASAGKCGRKRGSASVCTVDGRPWQPIHPSLDIVAGHVLYNTFATPRPAIYVTCLREPLNLKISAVLYVRYGKNRRSVSAVAAEISASFRKADRPYDNFLKRLGAKYGDPVHERIPKALAAAHAARAIAALESTFAVVGLTERYALFYAQLAALLPGGSPEFWAREVARRENPSAYSTSVVRNAIEPAALAAINATLVYERRVYDAAVAIHDRRCAKYLGEDACR